MEEQYERMYRDFYDKFKNPDIEQSIYFAKVESITPLRLRTNDLILYANNIKIVNNLAVKMARKNYVMAENNIISHNLNDFFSVNDTVLLIRQSNLHGKKIDDIFILIDKVVDINE